MKKAIRIFLILFIGFSTIFGTAMYLQLKPEVEKEVEKAKEENEFESLDVSDYKERVNVLLLGVDTLETSKEQTGTRSDTIMILSVDPITKTGFILSVPRDSYVKIHGTDDFTKLTHAHSYGGTDLALSTIKDFVDIKIHHYMKVDYRALFKAIDDMGGIEFDVPVDMKYTDNSSVPPLKINLKAGVQTLNGEQAMGVLRFRMGYPDKDFGRMRTQQAFIEALLKKMASPSALPTIPKHIETVYEYVETDMSLKDVMSIVKIGLSIDMSTLQKATIPGEPDMINGSSVIIIDKEKKAELIEYLLSGEYEKPETTENQENQENQGNKENKTTGVSDASQKKSTDSASDNKQDGEKSKESNKPKEPDKNDATIAVLNGSGKSGVARRASDLLKIRDILVDLSGNASSFDNERTVVYYKENAALANEIREILKVDAPIKKGTSGLTKKEADIVIILGKDFE